MRPLNKRLKIALTDLAFRLLSARGALSAKHLSQLALTGLDRNELLLPLKSIRSLTAWQREWTRRGDQLLAEANALDAGAPERSVVFKKASSMYYLAGLLHAPDHPDRSSLRDRSRRAYHAFGEATGAGFERLVIPCQGHDIHCNFYHPRPGTPLPILIMIPPLGSIKENIDFQIRPFLKRGYACIAVDLPGVGETVGAMPLDAQTILSDLISYLETRADVQADRIAMMGMSLGAYWTMKTAAVDERVRLAIGISTPAVSGRHWDRIPKHYWQYFQGVFQTQDMATTRQTTEQLSLFEVMDRISCPVLLFHGEKDNVSQPDAMDLFHRETVKAPLSTRIYPESGHCCLDQMEGDVLPHALKWFEERI